VESSHNPSVRILLVSQMYPGPADPDFGIFVADLERELLDLGHEVERTVIARRGGSRTKYLRLGAEAIRAARAFRPDVVYAHFLVPAGALAALAGGVSGAPVVVTAHGRDVRNISEIAGIRQATRYACRRASTVIAVSHYLRDLLVGQLPELAGKVEVVDCGVDLTRFRHRDAEEARARVGWDGEGPRLLFVGSLDDRKNPLRLADAVERLGHGQLALIGDGPLRRELAARPGVRLVGRIAHERVADWIDACDVLCQPSIAEPFGQAILEAMASERSVVATRIGGPPEFVAPGAGVLVDPLDVDAIASGLREALALPFPNPVARRAAAEHDILRQARRIASILERAAG
jgi:glycosyltransferase involved in cell wall biosynthesis